ncbi:SDR family NAD(P)-dependent oxidoreductase [Glutamicibacter nicotianae]|uniref:SDR family NAD(P)-dependent oxidoreductase n=1 Tax=Glutamicibacter nicotianae TaxID=37929 RepID=UPI0021DB2C71|nr:SDR family NAD(P)-dependent oxidoreductase [Glutamicibacter nicotianae]
MQLENKVVIVTGGASGIGGATSRVLARRGAKVVALDLTAEVEPRRQKNSATR